MDSRDLVKAFGEVDDELITEMLRTKERAQQQKKKKGGRIMKIMAYGGAAAAAAALIFASLHGGLHREISPLETVSMETQGMTGASRSEGESGPAVSQSDEESIGSLAEESVFEWAESVKQLSLSEDECLVIADGDTLVMADSDGRELGSLEGARMIVPTDVQDSLFPVVSWGEGNYGQGSGYAQTALETEADSGFLAAVIWDIDRPLPVIMPDEHSVNYRLHGESGMYSIAGQTWLCDPAEHSYLNLLSDTLWTDTECMVSSGSLLKTDGTVVDVGGKQWNPGDEANQENKAVFYHRVGSFIIGGQKVFDLEGNLLFTAPEGLQVNDVLDGMFEADVLRPEKGSTSWRYDSCFYDFDGNPVMAEMSGLRYNGHTGKYLNWIVYGEDGGEADYLITDLSLNQLISARQLFDRNPDFDFSFRSQKGNGAGFTDLDLTNSFKMQVAAVDEEAGEITLCFRNSLAADSEVWLVCDTDWNALRIIPDPEITAEAKIIYLPEEYPADDTAAVPGGEWCLASSLICESGKLFYVDERGVIARTLKGGSEEVITVPGEGETISPELAMSDGKVYYARNSRDRSAVCRCVPGGSEETLYQVENTLLSYGPIGLDGTVPEIVSDLHLQGVSQDQLIYRTGGDPFFTPTGYTSWYLGGQGGAPVSLMSSVESLAGVQAAPSGLYIVLEGAVSDASPHELRVVKSTGETVLSRMTKQSSAVLDGALYYRDDSEYSDNYWEHPEEEIIPVKRFSFAAEMEETISEEKGLNTTFISPAGLLLSAYGSNPVPDNPGRYQNYEYRARLLTEPEAEGIVIPEYQAAFRLGGRFYLFTANQLGYLDFEQGHSYVALYPLPENFFLPLSGIVYAPETDSIYYRSAHEDPKELRQIEHVTPTLSGEIG